MTDILDRALDSAARRLNGDASDLDTLTMQFLDSIGRDHQNEVLRFIVEETIGRLIAENCLLDEAKDESYKVQAEIAYTLTYAIASQGRQLTALRELVSEAIDRRAGAYRYAEGIRKAHSVPLPF